jgi:hypothetical protein
LYRSHRTSDAKPAIIARPPTTPPTIAPAEVVELEVVELELAAALDEPWTVIDVDDAVLDVVEVVVAVEEVGN